MQTTNLKDDSKTFCRCDAERPFSELSDDGNNSVGTAPRLRRNLLGVLNWEVAKWRWQTYLLLWYVCASSIFRLGLFTARTHSCALKWQLIWMGDEIINNLLKNAWAYNTSVTFKQTETCIEHSLLDNLPSACAEISWIRIPEVHCLVHKS
jgi:hypothetical protein